jgi:hypothetical protein
MNSFPKPRILPKKLRGAAAKVKAGRDLTQCLTAAIAKGDKLEPTYDTLMSLYHYSRHDRMPQHMLIKAATCAPPADLQNSCARAETVEPGH